MDMGAVSRTTRGFVPIPMPGSTVIVCTIILAGCVSVLTAVRPALEQPNIVIFLADDLGYGDLSSYGNPSQEFGPVDQMGREGMRFTRWYAPATFCTPSRGAMLTGRYAVRHGLYGDSPVFMPHSSTGLQKEEITIAEALKDVGYATGMVGKWHLGINEFHRTDGRYLPMHHGFDFVGTTLPFSNTWRCDTTKKLIDSPDVSSCFLYYNDTILQQPMNQDNLTSALLLDAKAFIYEHQHQPFFFYFALPHPHANMFSSEAFTNSSRRGVYGDNINEMSWAVGEILGLLRELHLEANTLAIFLSDHGPDREMCSEGGVAHPLKGWKGHTWEGGVRVPAIAWWPGTIPQDVTNHEVVSSMDLFSLALDLAGASPPDDRPLDGRSLRPILLGQGDWPRRALFHYSGPAVMAVSYGRHKLHYRTQEVLSEAALRALCGSAGLPARKGHYACCQYRGNCVTVHDPPLVFDVEWDPAEAHPLDPRDHSQLLESVARILAEHRAGVEYRTPLFNDEFSAKSLVPCCNPPYCWCSHRRGNTKVKPI